MGLGLGVLIGKCMKHDCLYAFLEDFSLLILLFQERIRKLHLIFILNPSHYECCFLPPRFPEILKK